MLKNRVHALMHQYDLEKPAVKNNGGIDRRVVRGRPGGKVVQEHPGFR